MKFRSPTETPIYMGLTSGHTFTIGPELVEVPKRFHRQAVSEGAIPEGMDAAPIEGDEPEAGKVQLVVEAIRNLVKRADMSDFTGDGKPDTRKLSAIVGFTVLASERNTAWAEFQAAEADQED